MKRAKELRIFSIALLVLLVPFAHVASITVVNPGFEEPGEGKISDDFSRIPGWSQDVTADSGVEDAGAYTGLYRGFGMTTDSEIYQLLDEPIIEGATYYLKFYGMDTWDAEDILTEFYYLTNPSDPTSRSVIASEIFPLSGEWTEYILSFVAESGQPYLGEDLGIQFIGMTATGTGWYGLDEISVERIQPEYAKYPDPYDGEIDVSTDRILSWEAGIYAASHDVYFGDDEHAVENATTSSAEYKGSRDVNNWDPDPDLAFVDATYYWRVDEVNGPNVWKDEAWEFTVQGHEKVDNFESYVTSGPKTIYSTWLDGWATHTGGAVVSLETGVVHLGKQSMELCYFNYKREWGCWSVVEADVSKFGYSTDWTANDLSILKLWFCGDARNEVYSNDRMYIALEDGSANRAVVHYSGDVNDIKLSSWQEWAIPYEDFAGVDMTNVSKLYIGLGEEGNNSSYGGIGAVYFDDIRLYPIYE